MKYLFLLLLVIPIRIFSWDISNIKLEKGYKIEVFASGLDNPRGLTSDQRSNIFTGSKSGKVYKVTPNKNIITIAKGLNGPVGIDFYNNDLYVSELHRIIVFKDINKQSSPYKYEIVIDDLPDNKWHGWKYIKVGPDKRLYINIGAPCNTCINKDERYGTISRINLDGSGFEIFVKGVRNSVGFDWNPTTKELWFTDNGPDGFGDSLPPDEINKVNTQGQHFGFPFIHGGSVKDPQFYGMSGDILPTAPEYELPAHVAPLGMRFYKGDILIAEHGSWNRSKKIGYRISKVHIKNGQAKKYSIFAEGWLQNEIHYGRPADLEVLSDNSIIISDDFNGFLYRVY